MAPFYHPQLHRPVLQNAVLGGQLLDGLDIAAGDGDEQHQQQGQIGCQPGNGSRPTGRTIDLVEQLFGNGAVGTWPPDAGVLVMTIEPAAPT